MKVYIAGPITGKLFYQDKFQKAAELLKNLGHTPVNPVEICKRVKDGTHEQYMNMCLPHLLNADAIVMLGGWENSEGAKLEYQVAMATGKKLLEVFPTERSWYGRKV